MSLEINIDEIEKAMLQLFNELRTKKGNIIEIEAIDYYWAINAQELYNPYNDPTELTLGQITDDLNELKKLANNESKPVSLDFVKISSILTMIGNKTVW